MNTIQPRPTSLYRAIESKPAKPLIALAAMQVLLLSGCASFELHLERQGCSIERPLMFTCPWELRDKSPLVASKP